MADDPLHPARRFLHVCYCTDDAAPVIQLFAEGLGLRLTMETPMERSSGAIFGMEDEIESSASFVYDPRGPRRSPAIEVQTWNDPAIVGRPAADPTAAGIQALGFAVPDLGVAVTALVALGCQEIGSGVELFDASATVLRDPNGVTLDIVEDRTITDTSHLRHLRITCTDLDASLPWYKGLGFTELGRQVISDASMIGLDGPVDGVAVRLRLPDEATEAILMQWNTPAPHGRHPADAFHAGLFRVAIGVDDTRASHDAMVNQGWVFDRAPMGVELHGTPVPDMWICFLSDPDGVPFEFVERPRAAFRD